MMEIAFTRDASDIHIDPEENIVLVQLRVDGIARNAPQAAQSRSTRPSSAGSRCWPRMDIAERRMAQDGRFFQCLGAATTPNPHSRRHAAHDARRTHDAAVAGHRDRAADAQSARHVANWPRSTFADYTVAEAGHDPALGPRPAAGKSTTLYAALRHRLANHPGRIITVEDPVEFDIVGVAQIEVDTADKVRFDTVLRNILRSDPDVIMIGEIRDHDSADVAIKAALTGHLVFSSIHTNSAAGVITRLIDMGLEPFQVAATVRLCIAQRLARRLCQQCRRPRTTNRGRSRRDRPARCRKRDGVRPEGLPEMRWPRIPRAGRTVRGAADRRGPRPADRRRRRTKATSPGAPARKKYQAYETTPPKNCSPASPASTRSSPSRPGNNAVGQALA